jgi:uncharacterized protein GlcG (DUF336 family)
MKAFWIAVAISFTGATGALADQNWGGQSQCALSQGVINSVQSQLATVITSGNGGLFTPNRMWSAIVDRQGVLCSVINSNNDPWPGSRDIAIAKATTANGFSNSAFALSTANLYGPTQPGGSLYGLNNSNPFNPWFNPQNTGIGFVPGGIITFGGGVALYQSGKVIGGLGVSGDTSCADHAIAYRMRARAKLNITPNNDNIVYGSVPINPATFTQPHCTPNSDITP